MEKSAMKIAAMTLAMFFAANVADAELDTETCQKLSEFAQNIMEARQTGVPLNKMISLVEKNEEPFRSMYRTLVIEAYKKPRYHTKSMQTGETTDYSNQVLLACLEAIE